MSDIFERVGKSNSNQPKALSPVSDGGEVPPERFIPTGNNGGSRRWSSNDSLFWGCKETHDNLPPGLYKASQSQQIGYLLDKQIVDTDELIILPDTASKEVIDEINKFWTLKPEFDKRGFIHKRGILLHGDPGSGKTSTIQLIIKSVIEAGNVAIYGDHPDNLRGCLQMVRRIEPERQIIVLLEDFEDMVKHRGESEFLALLDGESQVGNVVFIATTNYPEYLDKRFIDRPSRFDTVKFIAFPNKAARILYMKTKEPSLTDAEVEHWAGLSKGLSFAHLKEMIISNRCYGHPIEQVVDRLKKMSERKFTSDDARPNKGKLGFGAGAGGDED
jgi:SpoVK/Ycf46/Vps4 family AAA+-type ATPase